MYITNDGPRLFTTTVYSFFVNYSIYSGAKRLFSGSIAYNEYSIVVTVVIYEMNRVICLS